jgi:mono/diheme cytochrome c family protein
MRNLTLFLLFSFIILLACNSSSKIEDTDAKILYKTYCVTCHGIKGDLGTNGAINLNMSKLSSNERKLIITYGRNIMPSFESTLTKDQIDKIADYTLSFGNIDGKTN